MLLQTGRKKRNTEKFEILRTLLFDQDNLLEQYIFVKCCTQAHTVLISVEKKCFELKNIAWL